MFYTIKNKLLFIHIYYIWDFIQFMIYKDEKSNKFWNIEYTLNEYTLNEYRVKYGKVKTNGQKKSKISTLKNTEQLINSKLKKGYKQISNKSLKKFTI